MEKLTKRLKETDKKDHIRVNVTGEQDGDKATYEDQSQTTMETPVELVPAVRELIAKHTKKSIFSLRSLRAWRFNFLSALSTAAGDRLKLQAGSDIV